jgi:hypothetical protein
MRLLALSVIASAALFVGVTVASAHTPTATITCTQVSFNFFNFSTTKTNVIHETVTIDAQTVASQDYSFSGATGANSIPITIPPGTHTVVATTSWTVDGGGTQSFTQTLSACSQATPSLTTNASGPVTVGGAIHDTAHLSGGVAPLTGTLTFDVYDANCTTKLATVSPATTVNGAGDYNSANYTPATAGSYNWVAHYSGDANNAKVDTACGAPNETSTVNKTTPSIATVLSTSSAQAPATVHDSSTLTGATANAGGTVTYTVYTNTACNAGARAAGTKTVTNGVVPNSDDLVFSSAGDFYWQAVYSGDANNGTATSVCTSEHLVVTSGGGGGGGETQSNTPSTPSTPTTPSTPQVTTQTTPATITTTPTRTKPAAKPTPKKHKVAPKPKKKPFKPPVVKKTVKTVTPPCYVVQVGPNSLTAGKPATLVLRVTGNKKPIPGVKVEVKGPGIMVLSGRTNGAGKTTLTLHPQKPGLLAFHTPAKKTCGAARIGVTSAFTPPVTG